VGITAQLFVGSLGAELWPGGERTGEVFWPDGQRIAKVIIEEWLIITIRK
jgi:hypothetical protein